MTGLLIKRNNQWVVKYDRGHEVLFYEICEQSKIWTQKESVLKFLHENVEVEFNLIVRGSYDRNKQEQVREFCAKIILVEHSSI